MPLWTREGRALLDGLGLEAVDHVLPVMDVLDRRIKEMSLDLKHMCGEDPRARLLTAIPGVGYQPCAAHGQRDRRRTPVP